MEKMEDTGIPPHSTGNGHSHQNPVNHTRPFFYVQPPSQPLYFYQWQMSNPYGHYGGGYPGQGVPYTRPYMAPYPYMTCPGYIMPHAPMQPIDYRRMYNPHHPSGVAHDVRYQHQNRAYRETACSETQTEPGDRVGKLAVKLDGLRAGEQASMETELDSGVVSQTSGVFQHSAQQLSREGAREDPEPAPGRCPAPEAKLGGELVPAAGSNPGRLEELVRQDAWTVGPDGVLPLDSSSRHEESDGAAADESVHFQLAEPEKLRPASDQSNTTGSDREENRVNQRACRPGARDGVPVQAAEPVDATPEPPSANHQDEERSEGNVLPLPDVPGPNDVPEEPVPDVERPPYRILRLPCNELTTASLLQADALPPAPAGGYLPSLGNGYLYSYYPPVAPERQSVLSPSLDELSSRDDMFSTDLEDVDSVSGRPYTGGGGGSLALAASEVSDPEEEEVGCAWDVCATCGSSLNGDARRSKAGGVGHRAYPEDTDEEVVEGDDDDDYGDDDDEILKNARETQEVPDRHPHGPARHPPLPARHPEHPCARQSSQHKPKKAYSNEPLDPVDIGVQSPGYPAGTECFEGQKALAKPDHCKGQDSGSTQSRPPMDKPRGGGGLTTSQESWESYDGKPRPWKSGRPYPSLRGLGRGADAERAGRRRGACKTFVSQRSRRRDYEEEEEEEEEFARFQRGRGSIRRKGARY